METLLWPYILEDAWVSGQYHLVWPSNHFTISYADIRYRTLATLLRGQWVIDCAQQKTYVWLKILWWRPSFIGLRLYFCYHSLDIYNVRHKTDFSGCRLLLFNFFGLNFYNFLLHYSRSWKTYTTQKFGNFHVYISTGKTAWKKYLPISALRTWSWGGWTLRAVEALGTESIVRVVINNRCGDFSWCEGPESSPYWPSNIGQSCGIKMQIFLQYVYLELV